MSENKTEDEASWNRLLDKINESYDERDRLKNENERLIFQRDQAQQHCTMVEDERDRLRDSIVGDDEHLRMSNLLAQNEQTNRRAEAWKAVAEDLEDYARHTGSSRVGVCVTNYDTKKCSCRLWDVFEDMEAARALELEPGTVEEEEEEGRV
jgi:hypothetical protein